VSKGGSNWCSGGGQAQGDDGFVSPCLSHAKTPLPSSTPYPSDTHSHMLLSVKVLKDIVTQILKKQSLSTHPCVDNHPTHPTEHKRRVFKLPFVHTMKVCGNLAKLWSPFFNATCKLKITKAK